MILHFVTFKISSYHYAYSFIYYYFSSSFCMILSTTHMFYFNVLLLNVIIYHDFICTKMSLLMFSALPAATFAFCTESIFNLFLDRESSNDKDKDEDGDEDHLFSATQLAARSR